MQRDDSLAHPLDLWNEQFSFSGCLVEKGKKKNGR